MVIGIALLGIAALRGVAALGGGVACHRLVGMLGSNDQNAQALMVIPFLIG